jgi:DNA-binding transcriptional LysR family regulator
MTVQSDHLQSFLAVARAGSINRAAGELHRSQPNVTRQLQLLERDLDTVLFDRTPTGMRLTAAGRALVPVAESVAAALADAHRAVHDAAAEPTGTVRIAVVGTLADDALVRTLVAFRRHYPDVDVRIETGLSAAVSAAVSRGDADLGLRYGVDDDRRLDCAVVAHEPVVAVAAPDHRLAGRRRVTPSLLRGEQWFAFAGTTAPSDEPYTAALQATLALLGVAPGDLSAVDSLSAQKALVRAGLGLALLPASAVRDELDSGRLVALKLEIKTRTAPIVLVRRRGAYQSAAVGELAAAFGNSPALARRPGTRLPNVSSIHGTTPASAARSTPVSKPPRDRR